MCLILSIHVQLGFSLDKEGAPKGSRLKFMRNAELKHARLAMLASLGWPASELYHKELADTFGLESILASNDKAPSVMNGGTYVCIYMYIYLCI